MALNKLSSRTHDPWPPTSWWPGARVREGTCPRGAPVRTPPVLPCRQAVNSAAEWHISFTSDKLLISLFANTLRSEQEQQVSVSRGSSSLHYLMRAKITYMTQNINQREKASKIYLRENTENLAKLKYTESYKNLQKKLIAEKEHTSDWERTAQQCLITFCDVMQTTLTTVINFLSCISSIFCVRNPRFGRKL